MGLAASEVEFLFRMLPVSLLTLKSFILHLSVTETNNISDSYSERYLVQ